MNIDWAALGSVFLIAIVAVVIITGVFAFGVRGLAARVTAREGGTSGAAGLTTAVICFAVCVAIVGYGIYLIAA
ncbi:hypothetical protein [Amycolatopsis sp. GM8]|uniref:hypothetical protein n=1 Tax=Amycolatopsis sp. GM8 TaxID=2896530 RepID=UPI001F430309|nr:hypothetical protein [Amycolatopsis sp. GM8]